MHSRAAQLIAELDLMPHPEGGYFREIHRSITSVWLDDGRTERSALTVIYFLLTDDELSRWHRVSSDETWHFHEGDPLELLVADREFRHVDTHLLGPLGQATAPVRIVHGGSWQTARCTASYTLVSCSVGPGFDFADFDMLRDHRGHVDELVKAHPHLRSRI